MVPGDWLRIVSYVDPLTYVIDGFRYSMIGFMRTNPYYCLIAIVVVFVVCFVASVKMFESGKNLKT